MTIRNYLLCCDWGTTSFRLRLVNLSDYSVLAEHQSAEGVASTFKSWQAAGSPDRFEFYASKLKSAVGILAQTSAADLSNIPLIVTGMASSSIGMEEIPYASVPFSLDGKNASSRIFGSFNGPEGPLMVVSGVKTDDDVMRGEEAQLIGLIHLNKTFSTGSGSSIYVFPGTHSKHMEVEEGKMIGFKTYMTGEIFNLMSEHSILKDSVAAGGDISVPANKKAFLSGVEMSGPSGLLNSLFAVRTNQLFSKFTKEANTFFLSGLLIGAELRTLVGQTYGQITICSGKHLFTHYKHAAEELKLTENINFISPELIDKATIAGQVQLFKASNKSYE